MTPALFLKGYRYLAHCTLLLRVLPWLPTAHPDPLCNPANTVLCSSISLPSSMTRNLGFEFPCCSMNFLSLWMCPGFSSGRRKGRRIYSCVCSLHALGTQILSSERMLKVPSHCHACHSATATTLKELFGGYHGREEKKRKAKAWGITLNCSGPFLIYRQEREDFT